MSYHIIDIHGRRMRDSTDSEYTEETFDKCEQVISYYFDMDYGVMFGIVDEGTGETTWIERETDYS